MKEYTELKDIFERYISGQLNEDEVREFLAHVQSGEDSELLKELIEDTLGDAVEVSQFNDLLVQSTLDQSWLALQERINPVPTRKVWTWKRTMGMVASLLCISSLGLWVYLSKQSARTEAIIEHELIIPGQQAATLTLADGTQIRLAETEDGELAKDGAVVISKTADGQLLYEIKEGVGSSSGYNTLSTARGETYRVKLPDGTQVWLNASSSLRYAANFSLHASRNVQLKGEAYFEVARDTEKPFIVHTDGQEVQVLGTHFNISSYTEESAVRTTLLEGSVRIVYQNKQTTLQPGQQSNLNDTGTLYIRQVDTEPIISWINNEFMFDGDNIDEVMRKLERWYNLKVIYKGIKTEEKFGGEVSRFEEVDKVLQLLEKTGGVRFKIEGRTVYVFSE